MEPYPLPHSTMRRRPSFQPSLEHLEQREVCSVSPVQTLQDEWRSFLGASLQGEAPASPITWTQQHRPADLSARDARIPTVSAVEHAWGIQLRYTDLPPGLELDLTDWVNGRAKHKEVALPAGDGDLHIDFPANEYREVSMLIQDAVLEKTVAGLPPVTFGGAPETALITERQEIVELAYDHDDVALSDFTRQQAHRRNADGKTWQPFLPAQLELARIDDPNLWRIFRQQGMVEAGLGIEENPRRFAAQRFPALFGANPADDLRALQARAWRESGGNGREYNRILDGYVRERDQILSLTHQAMMDRGEILSHAILPAFNAVLFRELGMPVDDVRTDITRTITRHPRFVDAARLVPFPSTEHILDAVERHFASLYALQRRLHADQQGIDARNAVIEHGSLWVDPGPAQPSRSMQRTQRLVAQALATSYSPRMEAVRKALGPQAVAGIVNGTTPLPFSQSPVAQTQPSTTAAPSTATRVHLASHSVFPHVKDSEEAQEEARSREQDMQHALQWYNPESGAARLFTSTRRDSVMGRIFIGAIEQFTRARTPQERLSIARILENLTDIPRSAFTAIPSSSYKKVHTQLQALFIETDYMQAMGQKRNITEEAVLGVEPEKGKYASNETVQFHFDVATNGRGVARTELLPDLPEGPESFLLGHSEHAMFVNVEVATLQRYGLTGSVVLRVRVTLDDGTVLEGKTRSVGIAKPTPPPPTAVSPTLPSTVETLPQPNRVLVDYLRTTVLPTLEKVSETEWKSPNIGAGDQCKIWVQKTVVPNAFAPLQRSVTIPTTSGSNDAEWNTGNDVQVVAKLNRSTQRPLIDTVTFFTQSVLSGDIVQMQIQGQNTTTPHTFIVDRVTATGIWVFDSNWSPDLDETVRYRFVTMEKLSASINEATAYRIKP